MGARARNTCHLSRSDSGNAPHRADSASVDDAESVEAFVAVDSKRLGFDGHVEAEPATRPDARSVEPVALDSTYALTVPESAKIATTCAQLETAYAKTAPVNAEIALVYAKTALVYAETEPAYVETVPVNAEIVPAYA